MKKSLILAGMLSIGYAYAQEGRVGVNTEAPSATLEVKPSVENAKETATTNEGIIAPRLSKVRVANIATPTQGTMVYVLDENTTENPNALISAYTGSDAKVAKITEKGYYFYNGAEWVRVQYQDSANAEWGYDDATKRINLKRSGQTTGFVNKVYYDAQTGAYISYEDEVMDVYSNATSSIQSRTFEGTSNANYIQKNSKNITGTSWKTLNNSLMYFDETLTNGISGGNSSVGLTISRANKAPTGWVQGFESILRKMDNNTSTNLMAGTFSSILHSGSVSNYAVGLRSEVSSNTSGDVNTLYGMGAWTSVDANSSGNISNIQGVNSYLYLGGSSKITQANSFHTKFDIANGSTNSIGELAGFRYDGISKASSSKEIQKHYGVYLDNVTGGNVNYSIYTNAGKVRVGDLADTTATGNRQVVVDADGVLKVGTATSTAPQATTTDKICDATNAGTFYYKERTVNGKQVGTMGFCTKQNDVFTWVYFSNGANILQSAGSNQFGQGL